MNRRRLLVGGALAVLALAIAAGAYALMRDKPIEKRGSASEEFVTTEEAETKPPPKPEDPTPWPMYSYDIERTHVSPFSHRPPYRRGAVFAGR